MVGLEVSWDDGLLGTAGFAPEGSVSREDGWGREACLCGSGSTGLMKAGMEVQ